MADGSMDYRDFFISRAGVDAAFAVWVGRLIAAQGKTYVLQDEHFGHQNFMAAMDAALKSGARVVSLLSQAYLESDNCLAEAMGALTGDTLNRQQRLIPLRLEPCAPGGLLANIVYTDLLAERREPNPRPLQLKILRALGFEKPKLDGLPPPPDGTLSETVQILHPEIRPVLGFTGREAELEAVEAALWRRGGKAALTDTASAAVKGLGGVGKSVLAQEYAWRTKARYHGVWWIRAEKAETLLDDLIALGARLIPGLSDEKDRAQAAHAAVGAIAQMRAEKPWLLVYDNVEQPGDIARLTPAEGAHVLITTRWQARMPGVQSISVDVFPPEVAVAYLLEGAPDVDREDAAALARELGYLPLALGHARAYCAEAAMSYKDYRAGLAELIRLAPLDSDYPRAVFATFDRAIARAAERVPEAETLMGISAFLAPDNIPLDLIPETLMTGVVRSRAIAALGALSLVTTVTLDDGSAGISVHRLVQEVMKGRLGDSSEQVFRVAKALIVAPWPKGNDGGDPRNWPTCRRLQPHALAILDQPDGPDGTDNPALLLSLVAHFFNARAEYIAAEPLMRRALAIDEKSFGPDHPKVGIRLNNLAQLLQATNRLAEAEPLMRRALAIDEKSFGSDHPDVAIDLNNLAQLLQDTNRLAKAEPLMRRALAIFEASLGPEHPSTRTVCGNFAILRAELARASGAAPAAPNGQLATAQPVPQPQPAKRGWLGRLFGA